MTTNANITIFNARYDSTSRQKVYVPTRIKGVSYYESEGVNTNDGVWTDQSIYKMRIPYIGSEIEDDRIFLPEGEYNLSPADGYWTIHKGDFILLTDIEWEDETYTQSQIALVAKETGLRLITVTEYADNTVRGSDAVKHWRIGGV